MAVLCRIVASAPSEKEADMTQKTPPVPPPLFSKVALLCVCVVVGRPDGRLEQQNKHIQLRDHTRPRRQKTGLLSNDERRAGVVDAHHAAVVGGRVAAGVDVTIYRGRWGEVDESINKVSGSCLF